MCSERMYHSLSQTQEWVRRRGSDTVLHVRTSWPYGRPEALVLIAHGYGAHANRPAYSTLAKECNATGLAVASFDFHGHGYSSGKRALIGSYSDLVEDAVSVLLALCELDDVEHSLDNHADHIPIFLLGHSMGAAVMFLLRDYIASLSLVEESMRTLHGRILGMILLAPAFAVHEPSLPIQLVASVLSHFMPNSYIPDWMFNPLKRLDDIWSCEKYIDYVLSDKLSWHRNPRLVTADALLSMMHACRTKFECCHTPTVVIMDKEEKCVLTTSVDSFIRQCSLSSCVNIIDGRHDVLANRTAETIAAVQKWIQSRIK